jgi:transposase
MARPARCLRSVHHLLQPFRSLATGWRLRPLHGRAGHPSSCLGADDRHLDCSGPSARGLHHSESKAVHERSRGWLTSKIHALVDTNGLPVRLALTAGEAHDNRLADKLLSRLEPGSMLLADRGYDADRSEPLLRGRARSPIFHRDAIATSRSASAHICIEPAIWSNGSSTRSSTAVGSQAGSELPRFRPAGVDQAMAAR